MVEEAVHKLKLRFTASSLNVDAALWQSALAWAKEDAGVGIRHAPLTGTADYRTHVASITQSVACHFHRHGAEDYAIMRGNGRLHWGKVTPTGASGYDVAWEAPVSVVAGQSFRIPEGYAHQLENRGSEALVIVFGCPDAHLDDRVDRIMLPIPPGMARTRVPDRPGAQP